MAGAQEIYKKVKVLFISTTAYFSKIQIMSAAYFHINMSFMKEVMPMRM